MSLFRMDFTVTDDEARVIAAKLLENKTKDAVDPNDAAGMLGVALLAGTANLTSQHGNSSASYRSIAAQNEMDE